MKKVLCGLVIALMMTGSGYADNHANKLINKVNKLPFASPADCTLIGQRIRFHNNNAQGIYAFSNVESKKNNNFDAYEKNKSSLEHHVLMARANLEIYNLMCSVD